MHIRTRKYAYLFIFPVLFPQGSPNELALELSVSNEISYSALIDEL